MIKPLIQWSLNWKAKLYLEESFHTVWFHAGHPPLWLFMSICFALFFCIGVLFGNLNSIAMEPMGHVAGTAAAVIGSFTTLMAVVLSYLIGRAYDGSLWPMALGFVGLITVSVLLTRLVDLPDP